MSYSRDRGEGSKGKRGRITDELFNFQYNPADIESWLRLGFQVVVVVSAVTLIKSLDGDVCGQNWSPWWPQTWGIPSGCFVRGLIKGVPNDFTHPNISTTPDATGEAVTPPTNENQQRQ